MTIKFNDLNIVTEQELNDTYAEPYLEYLKRMDKSYIGFADGNKINSDIEFYKEIIKAMGGEGKIQYEYSRLTPDGFYDILCDLAWFEKGTFDSYYNNYVLVVYSAKKMLKNNGNKRYFNRYISILENIVNWWTNEIITVIPSRPNARRNFTIFLVN